jgi:hypothetical protein
MTKMSITKIKSGDIFFAVRNPNDVNSEKVLFFCKSDRKNTYGVPDSISFYGDPTSAAGFNAEEWVERLEEDDLKLLNLQS